MSQIELVTHEEYQKIIKLYTKWKCLNHEIKQSYSRGVNFPEAISEKVVCYVNGFKHSLGSGSEDAYTSNDEKVQIKATSNFDSDLTSFGPNSTFDYLHFARVQQSTDEMYLYNITIDELDDVKVNKNQTFKQMQDQGKRPRFSIIDRFIDQSDEQPYAIVDLITGNINRN